MERDCSGSMVEIKRESMIGWIEGRVIESWRQGPKNGYLIACNGVGYEIQLTMRHQLALSGNKSLTLWIHTLQRDDGSHLFGFPEKNERDLFRTLIGVNGIGPQMALALIQECKVAELLEAISQGDLLTLCKAQGIGKRTAERLVIDLRSKLSENDSSNQTVSTDGNILVEEGQLKESSLEELQTTLNALGYEDLEIHHALKAVAKNAGKHTSKSGNLTLPPNDTEAWLRASLCWLCQGAA